MGDFYADVDDLLKADPAELKELKALIEQDTAYFTNRSAEKVGTDKWQRVTGKRYLKLADKNYEHFSPNLLFPRLRSGVQSASRATTNRGGRSTTRARSRRPSASSSPHRISPTSSNGL
jgi:hypothetical protein